MNFIGSTAKTVAMISSALCFLPVTVIRPSREPQTNTRPPGPRKPNKPERVYSTSPSGLASAWSGETLNVLFVSPCRPQYWFPVAELCTQISPTSSVLQMNGWPSILITTTIPEKWTRIFSFHFATSRMYDVGWKEKFTRDELVKLILTLNFKVKKKFFFFCTVFYSLLFQGTIGCKLIVLLKNGKKVS